MKIRYALLGAVAALVLCAPYAVARTWQVARDGSGDFTTIQPAVDAASSGDTILIGPGAYRERHVAVGYPQWTTFVQITKDLTLIGAGEGQTVIGPEDVFEYTWDDLVAGFLAVANNVRLSVSDLTVENIMWSGIFIDNGRLELDRCEFRGCVYFAVYAHCPLGGWVRHCSFHDNGAWGQQPGTSLVFYEPSVGVTIEDCSFVHNFGDGIGVFWQGCQGIDIRDCTIDQGSNGVVFADGASGSIRNCTISHQVFRGIYLARCGDLVVDGNVITAIDMADERHDGVDIASYATSLTMQNNIVISDDYVLWVDARILAGEISGNHFLREGDNAWWVRTPTIYPLSEPRIINLENNYWGTTDTALLDQWIYDGNDDEDVDIFIDYLPLADGPVQTENTTWGTVKTLFR